MTDEQAPVADLGTLPSAPKPTRKWLGPRGGWIIFAVFAVVWIYFVLVCVLVLHYRSELPLILILGGFALASSFVYTMCYRLKPEDGITPQLLILIFLLGGFAAWVVPTALGPIWGTITGGPQLIPPISYHLPWGTVVELSKILVVVFIARWAPVKNARIGLFLGGAVGFGFSAFENLTYGLMSFANGEYDVVHPFQIAYGQSVNSLTETVVLRELFEPFGHPLFTAIIAAALFAGYRGGRFRVTRRLVVTFTVVAVGHTLWDVVPAIIDQGLHFSLGAGLLSYLVVISIGITGALVWRWTAQRANISRETTAPGGENIASGTTSVPTENSNTDP